MARPGLEEDRSPGNQSQISPFDDSKNPFERDEDEEDMVSSFQDISNIDMDEFELLTIPTPKNSACSFSLPPASPQDFRTCIATPRLQHLSSKSCHSIRRLGLDPASTTPESPQVKADNIVIVSDVPKGHAVGCDIMAPGLSFHQAPTFHHPFHGVHFAWVAQEKGRSGFFFFTDPLLRDGSTKILQWNQYAKTLGPHGVKVLEKDIVASARAKMSKLSRESLGPDDWERARIWAMMSSHITSYTLRMITHKSSDNWRVQYDDPIRDPSQPRQKFLDSNTSFGFSNNMLSLRFAQLAYTAHESVSVPASDTTKLIEDFLDTHPEMSPDDLVGEMQFLFVAGAVADNALCFDLWAKMARAIVLHSFGLPENRPSLAQALFVTLGAQLAYHDYVDGERLKRLDSIKTGLRDAIIVYKMRLTETCLMAKCQSEVHMSLGDAFSEMENWGGLKIWRRAAWPVRQGAEFRRHELR